MQSNEREGEMRAVTGLALLACMICGPSFAAAQQSRSAPAANPAQQQDAELQALIRKSNAYVGLLNRTLRAVESWNRYTSWVKVKTGRTGRERIIYGLYGLYDVRGEIGKAREAMQ